MKQDILNELTLCTFSTGSTMVREVLEDWLVFLGGRPKQIIFTISPTNNPPPIYEQLHVEKSVDTTIYLEPKGRSVAQLEPEGVRTAIEAAQTKWILLVKLDTLPFRKGHQDWLTNAIRIMEKYNCWGITGSGRIYHDACPVEQGYSKTQKFSNNFSIFPRQDWLDIQERYVGKNFDGLLLTDSTNSIDLKGDGLRFITEEAVETFLETSNRHMVAQWETLEWSVFHVNVWGEQLRKTRESYLARTKVSPYLFKGKPTSHSMIYPWDLYYGFPKPSLFKRLKIWFGHKRRKIFNPTSVPSHPLLSSRR